MDRLWKNIKRLWLFESHAQIFCQEINIVAIAVADPSPRICDKNCRRINANDSLPIFVSMKSG